MGRFRSKVAPYRNVAGHAAKTKLLVVQWLPSNMHGVAAVMDRHAFASTSAAVGRSAPLRETVIAAAAVA